MKKITILLALVLVFSTTWAQHRKKSKKKSETESATWFFLSANGGYGTDLYFNDNISNDKNVDIYNFNTSYSFFGKFGVNFPFGVGLAFEMGKVSFSQSFDIKQIDGSTLNYVSKVDAFEKTILLRHENISGGFIEIGPQFVDINSGDYYKKFTNLVFGFGAPLYSNNSFDINLGARFTYSLTDVMNNSYPNNATPVTPGYENYKPTAILSAQLMLGFNWHIGYFRKAKCDGHVEFIFM